MTANNSDNDIRILNYTQQTTMTDDSDNDNNNNNNNDTDIRMTLGCFV